MPKYIAKILAAILLLGTTMVHAGTMVVMTTSMGDITLELDEERAPGSVENFLAYARDGRYDGTIFHRVIGEFMIQGGGFDEQFARRGTEKSIENEANNGLRNDRGTIAMARTPDPHSATNQFFINLVDNDFLNHRDESQRGWGYAVFGKVVDGMDVVDEIGTTVTGSAGPFQKDVPQTAVVIESVRVAEPK